MGISTDTNQATYNGLKSIAPVVKLVGGECCKLQISPMCCIQTRAFKATLLDLRIKLLEVLSCVTVFPEVCA